MKNVALIPLRAGGKRVGLIDGLDKERAALGEHPLMAYTIRWAIESKIFDDVIAVTRSLEHIDMARDYGASVPFERPSYTVRDGSPDIEWVLWALSSLEEEYDVYSILRVTSPFRTDEDIRKAYNVFIDTAGADSLRTVAPVVEHPAKMWVIRQHMLLPLLPMGPESNPWHSNPTQNSFTAFIQTAGMEMAWTEMTMETKTIAGSVVVPYVADEWAALDINTKFDWYKAEQAVKHGLAPIPRSL